jgi:hypothetical protein
VDRMKGATWPSSRSPHISGVRVVGPRRLYSAAWPATLRDGQRNIYRTFV